MARVTRSQKVNIAEDSTSSAPAFSPIVHSPAPPQALANVTNTSNNSMPPSPMGDEGFNIDASMRSLKAAYRTAIGGGRKNKKTKNKNAQLAKEQVLEHAEDLEKTLIPPALSVVEEDMLVESSVVSVQPAAEELPEEKIPNSTTEPKFEQNEHVEEAVKYLVAEVPKSPVRVLDEAEKSDGREKTAEKDAAKGTEDSFVEQIICRSPAKPVSRIEDSVEALDRLEDAFEALDQAVSAGQLASPQKARKPVKSGFSSMRVKPTAPRAPIPQRSLSSMASKPPNPPKHPASLLSPKHVARSVKPSTKPTKYELPGDAFARKMKEQREARLAQGSSQGSDRLVSVPKIKSTKPPTKATFALPGEALSRKKKEAHEANLRAQEKEERKRREFKAKPIRKSTAPAPRETISSRARQSIAGAEALQNGSNLSFLKRGSIARPSMLANTSAPRAPPQRKASTGPSMSSLASQRTISSHDAANKRQRARGIYTRDLKAAEDVEREKREREAAAKQAREAAAERGRQASREWAERQRLKKLAESDKGLAAGYGPGGQLGLRG
ncbi:hypothetical protein BJ878DRAFT_508936 [Calycina marina]|uniref:Uncharacterized protein n=1 Tax=Calycina marina TaxID=1763456 RepID=A0A9P8CE89_9HELO|nr:hypothetical protein BJ878DRAFT_508936 [Calycina marina]